MKIFLLTVFAFLSLCCTDTQHNQNVLQFLKEAKFKGEFRYSGEPGGSVGMTQDFYLKTRGQVYAEGIVDFTTNSE